MRSAISFAFLATVYLMVINSVSAAVIYNQTMPAEPVSAFGSINFNSATKVADNFSVSGSDPIMVRSIRFIGTPLIAVGELPSNDFRITFLEDFNGVPGNALPNGDLAIGNSAIQKTTDGALISGTFLPVEYIIDLGEGIEVSPNTNYWISISNLPDPNNGWLWARAAGLLDQSAAGTSDEVANATWEVFDTGGMWFELRTTNVSEPSSFILAIAATVATVFIR